MFSDRQYSSLVLLLTAITARFTVHSHLMSSLYISVNLLRCLVWSDARSCCRKVHFAGRTINIEVYCYILELYVFPQMDEIRKRKALCFNSKTELNLTSVITCVKHLTIDLVTGEPIPCPSRSLDLTPLDFCLFATCQKNGLHSINMWCRPSTTEGHCFCSGHHPSHVSKNMERGRLLFGRVQSDSWDTCWTLINVKKTWEYNHLDIVYFFK